MMYYQEKVRYDVVVSVLIFCSPERGDVFPDSKIPILSSVSHEVFQESLLVVEMIGFFSRTIEVLSEIVTEVMRHCLEGYEVRAWGKIKYTNQSDSCIVIIFTIL